MATSFIGNASHAYTATQQAVPFGLTYWLSDYETTDLNSSLLTNAFSPFGKMIGLLQLWLSMSTTVFWQAILRGVATRSELNFYKCFLAKILADSMRFVACRFTIRKPAYEFPSFIT